MKYNKHPRSANYNKPFDLVYLCLQIQVVGFGHSRIQRIPIDRPGATDSRRNHELSLGIEIS